MNFVLDHSYLIPLLPLIGAAISGLLGAKILKGASHWPIWLGVGASAVMSIVLLVGMHAANPDADGLKVYHSTWISHWIEAGVQLTSTGRPGQYLNADLGALLDPLSSVMLCVVCGIGFLITVFSAGYMKGESGYFRFFAYLGLFIFMMTCLVMGNNLLVLYLGWEGVGLCSYLLIGYYYETAEAREAAKKAFIVNRVGDLGFAIGIMLIFYCFGTVNFFGHDGAKGFLELFMNAGQNVSADRQWALQVIPFALLLGAFGKSAQFPLYVWLPDAMAGPTPVSALIHAATMVTAGVYMIVRCGPMFYGNPAAMITITIIGCFTALLAATIAMRQTDLKKVFAYSTVSQLGFMFVAAGVAAPVAAIFHLMTHAFFKALLFLSSGVVMHAMHGELDMRKMSGLKSVLPKTNLLMLIGCGALAGFPLVTAGFYSKDDILVAAFEHNKIIGVLMIFCAMLTAYYTFRLYFRVFTGPKVVPQAPHHGHGHDDHHHNPEPMILILPLVILAVGAIFAGFVNFPGHQFGEFLGQSPSLKYGYEAAGKYVANASSESFGQVENAAPAEGSHLLHYSMMAMSGLLAIVGIFVARVLHRSNRAAADRLADRFRPLASLLDGKYFVDEIYQQIIVNPLRFAGVVLDWVDRALVDGVVFATSLLPQGASLGLKIGFQRGYVQGYALAMLAGLGLILVWVLM